jgi:hypothetical protein
MFDPMGDTRFTGILIPPADSIPNPVAHHRGSMYGFENNLQAISQGIIYNLRILGFRQCYLLKIVDGSQRSVAR